MAPEAVDGPGDGAADARDATDTDTDATGARDPTDAGTGSPIADRWIALDRGWQALLLGLGIVAVHVAGQAAGVF